jgi:hypothetical protein
MRTYRTILKLADHALCKMVKHVLLRPLRPELLAAKSTAVTINCLRREVTSVVGLYSRSLNYFEYLFIYYFKMLLICNSD